MIRHIYIAGQLSDLGRKQEFGPTVGPVFFCVFGGRAVAIRGERFVRSGGLIASGFEAGLPPECDRNFYLLRFNDNRMVSQ
jgi:hypothetical protein